jgi:uncharacterized protein (TIGR00255 family)
MRSMTGFGAATCERDDIAVTVHVASVNNRSVQVHVRSDVRDLALEESIKNDVRTALQRGSITVHIALQQKAGITFDRAQVRAAWKTLQELAHEINAPMPTIDRVIALVGNNAGTPADYAPFVRETVARAVALLLKEREREGQALLHACHAHALGLQQLLPLMRDAARARADNYRQQLHTRVSELLAGQPLEPSQLVRDVALYAERIDVTEEFVRLDTHLTALHDLLAGQDEQQGRKLEFLLQEIGREINTTGAKSNDATLTRYVLEAKALVDQLKEQVANVC